MAARVLSRGDVDFLLFDWLQVQRLAERAPFVDHSRETFSAALDTYQVIAEECFAPHNRRNDLEEPRFEDGRVRLHPEVQPALAAFCAAGLMAARQDEHLGGMRLPCVVERAGMAWPMAANVATAGFAFLTIAAAELLLAHADAAMVERFVVPMLAGRFFGTMCLSEPHAGSSLADLRTKALPQPDGTYRVFGNKMWISGGEHEIAENIVHLVLARIPDAEGHVAAGVQGLSLFLVPRCLLAQDGTPDERNDVVLAGLNHKMGFRGLPNCLLHFGEGRHRPGGAAGAIGHLVGRPGEGLTCMFRMMNEARIAVGLSAAALGYTGYLHALDHARQRPQGRLPGPRRAGGAPQVLIVEHADVRRMLLAQKASVEGALALALFCAGLVDEQRTAATAQARLDAEYLLDLLTPVTKAWPSRWCLQANDLAIQVHGGHGYTRDCPVEQFYRDNRLNAIHEGTNGIQAIDLLGRKVPQHGGRSLALLGGRIARSVACAEGALAPLAERLGSAWGAVLRVCEQLQDIADLTRRWANASPFLDAFGHVVLAWIWLEQARTAQRLLDEGDHRADFLRGKLQACRYFFHWELPQASTWLAVLDPLETSCLDMQDPWF